MMHKLYIGGITQVKAYRILQKQVAEVVRTYGFGSVSEWFVLSLVTDKKYVMAKDIAALLDVEAPLITRLVNNLLEAGLVETQMDQKDKRAKFVVPTDKAEQLVPKVQASLQKKVDDLLQGTTTADLESYSKVLAAIIENEEKI